MRRPRAWRSSCTRSPRAAKRLLLRRHPARGGRLPELPGKFASRKRSEPSRAPGEPGLAHPRRQAAGRGARSLSFAMLLNLASVCNAEDPAVLWGFISRYAPQASRADRADSGSAGPPRDRLLPRLRQAQEASTVRPDETERAALEDLLVGAWRPSPPGSDGEAIQTVVYEVGKRHPFPDLKSWFKALYEVLLGQSQGPRMGSFIALYGLRELQHDLVGRALSRRGFEPRHRAQLPRLLASRHPRT